MWIEPSQFKWEMVRILDEKGELVGGEPDLGDGRLVEMYQWMVLARIFDERALKLQRQGRIGTYAPFSGQEAAQIGSAFALEKSDWLFTSYREYPLLWVHGLPLVQTLSYSMGRLHGGHYPETLNAFPVQIIIAAQTLHAVGSAWASRYLRDGRVSVTCLGDGATSQGDFHEALNFASVNKLPLVFLIQNNQWAISVPRSVQSASETLAQKALGYGISGVQVDGNDILAVYQVMKEAVHRARTGKGPVLIEAVTYRQGPHTTADDPTRYRDPEDVAAWMAKDPLVRFKRYLSDKGLWDDDKEAAERQKANDIVSEAIKTAENLPKSRLEDVFDIVYEELPPQLKEQKASLGAGEGANTWR